MKMKLVLTSLMLMSVLVLGSANYSIFAQTQTTPSAFHLQFMAIPQKLIQNTDASLLVYAVDNNGNPVPIKIPAISVTSSDPSVVKTINVSSSEFNNSVKVDIHAGKIGSATITAATYGFLSSQVMIDVVGDAYKPEGLLVKATPSSFSHFGPYKGYVSVQLVNFFGNPVPADEDIVINLSSSDSQVVSLDQQVTIRKGENFVVREFTTLKPGITLLQAEVPGKWKESTKVSVSQPKTPLELKFYAAPQIAPALQGAFVYGFVQLQDANGVPVKADKDISVNVISDSNELRPGTGVIKKYSTSTMVLLRINTAQNCATIRPGLDLAPNNDNFNPCIELTAISKGFKTQSVLVEIRKPVFRTDLSSETRFDDPTAKIEPIIFPTFIDPSSSQINIEPVMNMPLLTDGSDQKIAVVQLMTFVDTDNDGKVDVAGTQPVVTPLDLPMIVQSDDELMMQIKDTKMAKGSTSALIEAKMGYQAGTTEMVTAAEFFGESFTQLTLHGHSGVSLVAEPIISKIMAKTDFPYIVYLKDADGVSAYSIGDMQLSISKTDKPEAEIGVSKTTTEILTIESGMLRKGSPTTLLKATSKGKGSSTITIESSIKDLLFSTTNTITMNTQLPEKLGIFIPSLILGNAKYTIPLQVLDKDGFPIKTISDAEVLLVPSVQNVVSTPHSVIIPKNQYYTTLLIEASGNGKTEVTALANNFQSTKLDVEVATAEPKLVLTPSTDLIRVNDEFTVTLSSEYLGMPLRDLQIKWSSDKAKLIDADEITDEEGRAEATFLINSATPFVVTTEVNGYGYENTLLTLNLNSETPVAAVSNVVEPVRESSGFTDVLAKNSYFLILPVIGGVIFWLVKTERLSLPFGRLFERFRNTED